VLTPWILRSLGADGFGVWSLFFALTGYLGALDLGFSHATLRFVSAAHATGDDRKGGEIATLSILGYVALGALWLIVLPLLREPLLGFLRISPALRPGASFAIAAGAVVFVLVGFTNTCIAVLQGSGRFDLANVAMMAISIGQATGVVFALRNHAGLQGMVTASAAGWVGGGLVALVAIARAVPAFRWSSPVASFRHVREMVGFGGPMQLANMLGVAHQQIDKVFLTRFVALAAVAPYELGLRVSTAASTFSQILLLAIIPAASAMFANQDHAGLQQLYQRAHRYVASMAAVLAGAIAGSAGPMFVAWLGAPSPGAELAVRGLVLAAYLAMAAGVANSVARGAGRTDLEAEFSAVAFVIHVGLALFLVPRFHMTGALVAIVTGNLLGMWWFLWRLSGALEWRRLPVIAEPMGWPLVAIALGWLTGHALSGLAPGGAFALPWVRFAAIGAASALAAVAVLLVTGFLPRREIWSLLTTRTAEAKP
jgi:O-antigen/teichoic acid export membrane protein